MHIPNTLPTFEEPTYLIVLDHQTARIFFLHERNIEEQSSILSEYPPMDNFERTSTSTPAGMHFAEMSENTKDMSLKKLLEKINEMLMQELHKHTFEHLLFAVPEDAVHILQKEFHPDITAKIKTVLPKILTKQSPFEILEHVTQS